MTSIHLLNGAFSQSYLIQESAEFSSTQEKAACHYLVVIPYKKHSKICLSTNQSSLYKIPKFHWVSWCGHFVETRSFLTISGYSPETLWKLYVSKNFHMKKLGRITVFNAAVLNLLKTSFLMIQKSVYWLSSQIRWLVFIWYQHVS